MTEGESKVLQSVASSAPSVPLRPGREIGSFALLAPQESGVAFRNDFDWDHPRRHLYEHGFAGGGVAIGDVDGNGLPDLYLVSQTGRDALYVQTDVLRFEDETRERGIDHDVTWGSGATFADVDGDGDLDLHVCSYDAPNLLYVNQGDGTFREEAAARGVAYSGASVQASFADHDRDGDLDLYLVTNRLYPGPGLDRPHTRTVDGEIELSTGDLDAFQLVEAEVDGERHTYVGKAGQPDRLFRNDGSGRFEDVTEQAGLFDRAAGLSATWWDYDGDLWPDLYVANDYFAPDRLYRNRGDGTFEEVLRETLPHTPWFSMGSAAADLDGDGRVDLVATDMAPTTHYRSKIMMGDMADSRWFLESAEPPQVMRNAVYRNTGTPRFLEVAFLAGLAKTDWTWSVKLADLDCDGDVDAYFTNGSANNSFDPDLAREVEALVARLRGEGRPESEVRAAEWQLYRSRAPRRERNLAFRNAGELRFEDASAAWAVGDAEISYGAALSDLDRDGDLDLVVNHLGAPAAVYRNDLGGGKAMLLRLRGRGGNSFGIGASVRATTATRSLVRQVFAETGYLSGDEPLVHLGLGAEELETLTIEWPSGHVQRLEQLAPNRFHTVDEPEGPAPPAAIEEPRPTRFERRLDALLALDPELPFDDFAREPLLPYRLSRQGPGLAWGDVDGDGRDDLFVSGSAGHASSILVAGEHGFVSRIVLGNEESEDVAGLFLDVDRDGDLDLVVGAGGVECEAGDERLQDRLYLNKGGRLVLSERLPDARESTGAACAADVDADGDLDLFLGARSIPGAYPTTPRSRLLRNDDGRYVDVTAEDAPALERVGLVTAAVFSDVDADGDPDLLVACEWGPVSLFLNASGTFADATARAGLADRLGWWNGIASGDLDADGDVDFLVTNAGWNTKYHASAEHPTLLFHGDLGGDGGSQLVEAAAEDELLPIRGLSCSSAAMPGLRERLPTYDAFARATLEEIYTPERLGAAGRLEANELASGVLRNETTAGGPRFSWHPLPRLAQTAPSFGAVLADLDADGDLDAFLAQNFFWREPETGRWDGGLGALLDGDGMGGFRWVEPADSGIVVPGEGRAVTLCDANRDGRAELVVGCNGGPLLLFERTGGASTVAVRLAGPPGNPLAAGGRITAENGPSSGRVHEITAGSAYLSQSTPDAFFSRPPREPLRVRVRWPDGVSSSHEIDSTVRSVALRHP